MYSQYASQHLSSFIRHLLQIPINNNFNPKL